ncbi:hypothetical protein BGW80DRAFT_614073 [Lactifluus volemus]|nr:hypothetical protein BGW80DRAFT_614073 [Lactifluus volemus]
MFVSTQACAGLHICLLQLSPPLLYHISLFLCFPLSICTYLTSTRKLSPLQHLNVLLTTQIFFFLTHHYSTYLSENRLLLFLFPSLSHIWTLLFSPNPVPAPPHQPVVCQSRTNL